MPRPQPHSPESLKQPMNSAHKSLQQYTFLQAQENINHNFGVRKQLPPGHFSQGSIKDFFCHHLSMEQGSLCVCAGGISC